MPTYVETHDETKPAGTRDLALGDDDIREAKRAFRERLATDHDFRADESGITTIGYHTKVTLSGGSASDQTAVTSAGVIFPKLISSRYELCYIDDAGQVVQLTTNGRIKDSVIAQTGDWMTSSVTTARSGWTNVSATYSNKFMRINATPLTTGGADTHTHGVGTYAHSHTHTYSHTHDVASGGAAGSQVSNDGGGSGITVTQSSTTTADASSTAITGASASGDNVPAYVQVVIFQKD